MQRLNSVAIQHIFEFVHRKTFALISKELLDGGDKYNHTQVICELYGRKRNDPEREIFLLWVNLLIINIDIVQSVHVHHLIPWKHVKSLLYVVECELLMDELNIATINDNPMKKAGNTVAHSLDISYWKGDLTQAMRWEDSPWKHINLSYSDIPASSLVNLLETNKNLELINLYKSTPYDLSNNSQLTNSFCSNSRYKKLLLSMKHFGIQAAMHLRYCPNLSNLYLNVESCDNGVLNTIIQNTRLRSLTFMLQNGWLSELELSPLILPSQFQTHIEKLELSDTIMSVDQCGQILLVFPLLVNLIMHNCQLTNHHISALFLNHKNIIQEFGLSGNSFDGTALELICSSCNSLQRITIDDNDGVLSDEYIEQIVESYDHINFSIL
jgi:hypothetical protein